MGQLFDADGLPATGIDLRFWSPKTPRNTTTDGNGQFVFATYEADDTYDVDALLTDGAAEVAGARRVHVGHMRLLDGDAVMRLPFARRVLVEGVLTDDSGRALAGRELRARHADQAELKYERLIASTTDAEGRFKVLGWALGPVELEMPTASGTRRVIQAGSAAPAIQPMRFGLAPHEIAGRVVSLGKSVEGAVVALRRNRLPVGSVTVGSSGVFRFIGLDPDGTFDIRCELEGHFDEPRQEHRLDDLRVEIQMSPRDSLVEGQLLDANGTPLSRTWLRFVSTEPKHQFQAMTDFDGRFRSVFAADADFDVFPLVVGPDGLLIAGGRIGTCRGGRNHLEFRLPR